MQVAILSPTDLRPGAVGPHGQVVKHATMLVNEAAGLVMVAVAWEHGKAKNPGPGASVPHAVDDVFSWPLSNGWSTP